MYGLWLFKEIQTEYGHCKVEIFRKGYSGSQIEIGALAANSLTISLENLSEITAPVGKSVCSFEIIDTEQIAYDDFFTPDATYYKVVVSTKVGAGAYVTRWSGYITPDFFAENLTYRTPISISARDNIGYLNDVDFDLTASSITVRELIQSAFRKIAADYPISLSFVSQKQTAEGILAIDATISTLLLKEMSWGEALETILHDLGLQMRWVDNNTIAVLDLSQIPEYYPTQAFNFIHSSGYREIAPAWRQLSQSQDYGLRENFFEGWMRSDNLTFIKSQTIQTPDEYYGHDVRYYTPNNWGVARDIYTTDPAFYNSSFGEKIIFSAVSKDNPSTTYMSWSADILTSNKPLTIKFKAMNSVLYPYGGIKPYPLQLRLYDPFLAFARTPGDYLQIGMRFNLFLHTKDNTTYVMREDWVEDNGTGGGEYLNFTLDKISLDSYQSQEGSGSFPIGTRPSEKELTITANTIPYDGVLELRIYGYYVADYKFGAENGTSVSHNPNFDKFFAYINEPIYTFDNADIPTGQDTAVQINELHNVKGSQDYTFGEVPLDHGGINAYAGGLFKADGSELYGFQRNAEGQKYNLLELVGREIIHFNKDNYNRLSGTIKNLDKEPLMFNRLLVREGKTYYPYNCSLNVISNEMNITAMQEVEPYTTASFTEINSEVVTGGGATVGSGNNTVLQYSEEAGNVKRIYELEPATAEEIQDAEIIVDNEGWAEAKKYPASQLAPLLKRINVGTDEEPQWAVIPVDYEGKPVGIVSDTFITAGGKKSDDPNGIATTLGGLNNVDAAADDLQSEAVVLTKGVNATHWTLRALSTLGLNKAELENYLATNSYLKKDTADSLYTPLASFNALNTKVNDFLEGSDTDAIINKWKELEAFLQGQTESSTLAELLAVKANQSALDAHIANYNSFVNNTYAAHIAAYNTHITDYNSFKNTTNDRLVALESLWAIDEENNALYPRNSRGIWSYDFITAGGKANSGSSSGGLIQAVYDYNNLGGNFNNNNLTDTFNAYAINSIYNEVQKLKESAGSAFNETALWQSLAKVDATKVIDSSHIPDLSGKYLSVSGGAITGSLYFGDSSVLYNGAITILFRNASSSVDYGTSIVNAWTGGDTRIILDKSGVYFRDSSVVNNILIHSGNYSSYALPLSGGTVSGKVVLSGGLQVLGSGTAWIYFTPDVGSGGAVGVSSEGKLVFYDTATRTVIHSGNYSDYALPLSGGTINGSLSIKNSILISERTATRQALFYKNADSSVDYGTNIRDVSDSGNATLNLTYDNLRWNDNIVIHSGNIGSQSVNYANNSGSVGGIIGDLTSATNEKTGYWGYLGYGSIKKLTLGSNYGGLAWTAEDYCASMMFGCPLDTHGFISIGYNNPIISFAGSNNTNASNDAPKWYWKLKGTSGTTYDLNCAPSATKLQTAITIWGQSFDGTGDVNGRIVIKDNFGLYHKTPDDEYLCYIGHDSVGSYALFYNFRSGSSIRLNDDGSVSVPDGNVGIGINKPQYKLDVSGTLNAGATTLNSLSVTNNATIGGTLGVTGKSTLGELSANATTLLSLGVSGDTTLAGLSAGVTEVSSLTSNGLITGVTADFGSTTVADLYSESYVRGGAARFTSLEIATWYTAQGKWKYGTINTGRIYFNTPTIEGAGLYSDSDAISVHAGLNVDGTIDAYGDIFSEGEMTAGAIGSSSDKRLKNDIELLEPERAISLIMSLKPSTWKWNCNSKLVGKRSYGLIAQEVAPYLPEAVMNNKDYLSLVYNQFHAFEISVLQNHETRLERVERENREMKCEIERLNKELNQYRRA